MSEIALISEDRTVLAALNELGTGTFSDLALKTLRPTSKVEVSLQRLEDGGVVSVKRRRGIETRTYYPARRSGAKQPCHSR